MSDSPGSELLPLTDTCNFTLPDGSKCRRDKSVRGYCDTHYRVLRRANAFEDIKSLAPRSDLATLASNVRAVRRARKKLLRAAPDFVDHLIRASEVAAESGKSSPAEWALLHSRTVEPIASNTAPTNSGTTINIGVKVSGVDTNSPRD